MEFIINMLKNKKSLGQHWLKDREILLKIASDASFGGDLTSSENDCSSRVALEIGPGLGTLTSALFRHFEKIVAVEFDAALAAKLPLQFPGKDLTVFNEDFLQFDLSSLPAGYIAVGNIPYYITAKIVRKLLTAENRPSRIVLLVQKEVAERMVACESLLGLSVAVYADARLGLKVGKEYFTPPPKVDSQVVILDVLREPRVSAYDLERFWKMAHAGFSAPRKKLAGNLAGFFNVDKNAMREVLASIGVSPDARAEDLSLVNWMDLLDFSLVS
jgi:16S rRNA (adenine1518-N6/adenine1519-N6)-dimethyltransferase